MTTLAPPPAVTEYANTVRHHLSGLDAETLDELTGGLEADLAEALAERAPDGDAPDLAAVTAVFGSPADYAEELRVAAGVELPDSPGSGRPPLRTLLARQVAALADDWRRWRAEHRWADETARFVVSLRPAWWLLRGWILFHLVTGLRNPFFGSGLDLLLLLALVVASVLWGQGRIGQRRWWRRLGMLATAVALVAVVPVLGSVYNRVVLHDADGYSDGYQHGYSDGQWAGGEANGLSGSPANLFVYDAAGKPVEQAQILDQDGNPVVLNNPTTGGSWADWDGYEWNEEPVPSSVLDSGPLNVYPWAYVGSGQLTWSGDGVVGTGTTEPDEPRWPAASLFPIDGGDPEPDDATDPNEATTGDEATDTPSDDPADEDASAATPTEEPTAE